MNPDWCVLSLFYSSVLSSFTLLSFLLPFLTFAFHALVFPSGNAFSSYSLYRTSAPCPDETTFRSKIIKRMSESDCQCNGVWKYSECVLIYVHYSEEKKYIFNLPVTSKEIPGLPNHFFLSLLVVILQ